VEAVAVAGQSVLLVSALEALAAVLAAQGRPQGAAMLLGTAHTARELAAPHMRPVQSPDEELPRSLAQVLGTAAYATAYSEGERLSPAQALQAALPSQRDSS